MTYAMGGVVLAMLVGFLWMATRRGTAEENLGRAVVRIRRAAARAAAASGAGLQAVAAGDADFDIRDFTEMAGSTAARAWAGWLGDDLGEVRESFAGEGEATFDAVMSENRRQIGSAMSGEIHRHGTVVAADRTNGRDGITLEWRMSTEAGDGVWGTSEPAADDQRDIWLERWRWERARESPVEGERAWRATVVSRISIAEAVAELDEEGEPEDAGDFAPPTGRPDPHVMQRLFPGASLGSDLVAGVAESPAFDPRGDEQDDERPAESRILGRQTRITDAQIRALGDGGPEAEEDAAHESAAEDAGAVDDNDSSEDEPEAGEARPKRGAGDEEETPPLRF